MEQIVNDDKMKKEEKLFEVKLRVLAELDVLKKLIENDLYDLAEESFQRLKRLMGEKTYHDYDTLFGLVNMIEASKKIRKSEESGS